QAGGGREDEIGRGRADDDQLDLGGFDTRGFQRAHGGMEGQVPGGLALGGDVALADAGARRDPFVGRVDELREVVVGQDLGRQVAAGPCNARVGARCGGLTHYEDGPRVLLGATNGAGGCVAHGGATARASPAMDAGALRISLPRPRGSWARSPGGRGRSRRRSCGGAGGSRPTPGRSPAAWRSARRGRGACRGARGKRGISVQPWECSSSRNSHSGSRSIRIQGQSETRADPTRVDRTSLITLFSSAPTTPRTG